MKGYLLDTDILIDWLRGKPQPIIWMKAMVQSGTRLCVSGISIAELYSGMSDEQYRARELQLTAFDYRPLTFDAARLAGQLRYKHLRAGLTIALPDMLQAAIALTEDLTLATANTTHFPDVQTVNPRSESAGSQLDQ